MSDGDVLVIGYAAAGLVLLQYFLWEDGPCHHSRRVESGCLTLALLLVYGASMLSIHNWEESHRTMDEGIPDADCWAMASAGVHIRQIMRILLLRHIFECFVRPRAHPRFFDGAVGARRSALAQVAVAQTPQARRISRDLQEAMAKSLATSGGSVVERCWAPCIFVILMVSTYSLIGLSTHENEVLARTLFYLEVVLLALWAYTEARMAWMQGSLSKRIHELVSEMVRGRGKGELTYVLTNVSVGTLFEVARVDTIRQLTDLAVEQGLLNTISKAILLHALQQKGLRHSKRSQKAVHRIIVTCRGQELTKLKNLIDGSGDYLNLHKLVYEDIRSESLRAEILKHFAAQARQVREDGGDKAAGVKVLSDVDDTLYSSGGKFPAGCDKRYPRHVIYPGCLTLFRLLDRSWDPEVPSCNIVFLSARPHVYKDLTEDHSYQLFRGLVEEGRMHSAPTLLPGKLRCGAWAALTTKCVGPRAWKKVGEVKFATFVKFRQLYSEYDFVFCGDDGQGDLLAAQHMLDLEMRQGEGILAALIHEVLPDGVAALSLRSEDGGNPRPSLLRHRSYVGAATALHLRSPDLLSAEQLAQVATSAVEEFELAKVMYSEWQWTAAEVDLASDLAKADEILAAAGLESLPPLKPKRDSDPSVGDRSGRSGPQVYSDEWVSLDEEMQVVRICTVKSERAVSGGDRSARAIRFELPAESLRCQDSDGLSPAMRSPVSWASRGGSPGPATWGSPVGPTLSARSGERRALGASDIFKQASPISSAMRGSRAAAGLPQSSSSASPEARPRQAQHGGEEAELPHHAERNLFFLGRTHQFASSPGKARPSGCAKPSGDPDLDPSPRDGCEPGARSSHGIRAVQHQVSYV